MQLARYAERLAIVSSVSRATSLRFVSRSVSHNKRFRAIEENAEFEAPLRFDTDNAESAESATTPLAPTDPTESRNLTIKDIPPRTRHLMMLQGRKLPVQVVIGRKGVDDGVVGSLMLHFRRREMVKISVSRQWKDNVADIARQLEERSGGIVIDRAGRRILLFRGGSRDTVPEKSPGTTQYWWDQLTSKKE